jgi:adenylate cyclase, class 2
MPPHQGLETEVKLPLTDTADGITRLQRAGFTLSKPRIFEANTVFDTRRLSLRRAQMLLRLREVEGLGTLTYKGPPVRGKHKVREEIETPLPEPASLRPILARLGYKPVFRYEKYRTEFRDASGRGMATLDETPVGVFIELEGPGEWIDDAAVRLGFSEPDYITESYGALYVDWCRKRRIKPGHMVFER